MLSLANRLLFHFRRYWIGPSSIWLRQGHEWVELRRSEIAAVKFETVSRVIVRYYDGQRLIVSLYGFSHSAYDNVRGSLGEALRNNQQTRGLWNGADS
jgi:hypothetical protein